MVSITARPYHVSLWGVIVGVLVLALASASLVLGGLAQAQDEGAIEYAEDRTDAVATFTATDPEGADISWSLAGTDESAFKIAGGVLTFAKSPDYENPTDVEGTSPSTAAADDNMYEVTVQATDETMQVGTKEVMVEVTNVDEAGTVTLSSRRPQSATAFTAEVSDPDGDVTNPMWQWSKASSRSSRSYADIEDAEEATYEPVDDDNGYYLRATVTYTDPEGSDKTAMATSEYPSQGVRGSNNAPAFAADQDPVMEGDQASAAREVAENTMAGEPVGAPVTAEDDDGDTLTYTLWDQNGTSRDGDSASFDIDWGTGQIMTKAALNHETGDVYTVVVRATDPAGIPGETADSANSDDVTVVITITDVNEAPAVTGNATATFNEDTGNIDTPFDTYAAADPESDTPITWSVAGADGAKFTAEGGALMFKAKPDFEAATDANGDNVYEVTVVATAGGKAGMRAVKVTVENADEDGVVTLNKVQPRVGIPVTASLTDPDGSISRLTWQWSEGGNDIEGATSETYTPKGGDDGDIDDTLVATASYTDGEGAEKTAAGTAANVVAADTRNKAPVFGDEDLETDGVQNDMAARKVEENIEANAADDSIATDASGDNVGLPVTATDPDPNADPLTYTLSGPDAGSFRVRQDDPDTANADEGGQIEVGAGTELDAETNTTYMVTVTAEDSFGATASIDVTITITGVDEMPVIALSTEAPANNAPAFAAATDTREVAENTAAGVGIGMPVAATDADAGDTLFYSLGGDDAASFDIDDSTGQLMTKAALDYESKDTYTVTVTARDPSGGHDEVTVTITVTDVDETAQTLLQRYDDNNSGAIDKDEMIAAIKEYLFGVGDDVISKEDMIEVIKLYLFG